MITGSNRIFERLKEENGFKDTEEEKRLFLLWKRIVTRSCLLYMGKDGIILKISQK